MSESKKPQAGDAEEPRTVVDPAPPTFVDDSIPRRFEGLGASDAAPTLPLARKPAAVAATWASAEQAPSTGRRKGSGPRPAHEATMPSPTDEVVRARKVLDEADQRAAVQVIGREERLSATMRSMATDEAPAVATPSATAAETTARAGQTPVKAWAAEVVHPRTAKKGPAMLLRKPLADAPKPEVRAGAPASPLGTLESEVHATGKPSPAPAHGGPIDVRPAETGPGGTLLVQGDEHQPGSPPSRGGPKASGPASMPEEPHVLHTATSPRAAPAKSPEIAAQAPGLASRDRGLIGAVVVIAVVVVAIVIVLLTLV